ncbi:MAG: outer membrane protein assembly factor BamD [Nitrospirota bacterium]
MRKILPVLLIIFFLIVSCSGKPAIKPQERFEPDKAFEMANQQLEKKEYEKARAAFLEIKNRDFSKKLAPLAQLKIADSYLREDEHELAIAEYKKFLDVYPDHQYAPYAQYQIATIHFDRIEGPERGYSGAAKALEEFEKLKSMYPRNPYKDVVKIKIDKCRNIIAEYEHLVGKYYYKKGSYNAALGRFEELLKEYPDYNKKDEVLYYAGLSYKNLGKKEKAVEYLSRLVREYPNSKLIDEAKKELTTITGEA